MGRKRKKVKPITAAIKPAIQSTRPRKRPINVRPTGPIRPMLGEGIPPGTNIDRYQAGGMAQMGQGGSIKADPQEQMRRMAQFDQLRNMLQSGTNPNQMQPPQMPQMQPPQMQPPQMQPPEQPPQMQPPEQPPQQAVNQQQEETEEERRRKLELQGANSNMM